jgi:hypothetical protein
MLKISLLDETIFSAFESPRILCKEKTVIFAKNSQAFFTIKNQLIIKLVKIGQTIKNQISNIIQPKRSKKQKSFSNAQSFAIIRVS